jgi:hypothetical protein
MRVFTFVATLLFAGAAFAQRPVEVYGARGPYVPLITTPQISLSTVSPNSVGASNATYGLSAGARNSTLSMMNGNTSSSFTEPVWYQGGGAPLVSEPEVELHVRGVHGGLMHHDEGMAMGEHGGMAAHAGSAHAWTYFSAGDMGSPVEASASAKGMRKATRTITNQDIDAENQKTGTVKYSGKTEKIQ